ncbi:MAG: hypothetical protein AAF628_34640 [Planctomycetota bacterium]
MTEGYDRFGSAWLTHEWDGATWRQTSVGRPTNADSAVMAYDRRRQTTIRFGDAVPFAFLDETWEWDGTSWQELSQLRRPPGRFHSAAVWDPSRGRIVVFGGLDSLF